MMQSQQIPMTFQRYETKYMLSPIMVRKLRKSLPGPPFAGKTRLQRKTATPQLWSGQRDQPHIRRTKEKI